MNDEQFEKAINKIWLFSPSMADQLRARNTAQREALARVEAERDQYARVASDALAIFRESAAYRDDAQAHLAEAVGLLRQIDGGEPLLDCSTAKALEAFIARTAKAEQQEAQSPLAKIAESLRQKAADEWASHPSNTANQEAQGAQAGDERAPSAVDKLARRLLTAFSEAEPQHPITLNPTSYWATFVDMARAALATQPAAGEPIQVEAVAVTRARKNGGLALEWLIEGGISALEAPGVVLLVAHGTVIDDQGSGEVYLAPPAAAHGDEAVPANLKARCQEISQWRKTGVLQGDALREYAESRWPGDHSALQMAEHETASEAFQIVAAMRAQGDGV